MNTFIQDYKRQNTKGWKGVRQLLIERYVNIKTWIKVYWYKFIYYPFIFKK